jgi:endonuclease G
MATSVQRFALILFTLPLAAAPLAAQELNRNAALGLPHPAGADLKHRDAYLIERPQYVLSYNAETRTPNWVCWRLRRDDIGNAPRAAFEPDPDLPRGIAHVISHDYDGSGFDRGHMCPAKDRSRSLAYIGPTFYTTNIVPQSHASNEKGWERLESYCRELARDGRVLYIACGPHGIGGTGRFGYREEIGKGRFTVTVPARLWKVILVLPHEGAEPTKRTRVIAVIMPNNQRVEYDWTKYRVSVHQVEKLTGYRFFPAVPESVAQALRERVDDVAVRVPIPRFGRGGNDSE